MTEATPAPADAPVLDPNDPRSHPHHYIVRKKDSRKTRARAYHVSSDCATIGKIADDSVLEDLSIEVVEYLGLGACSTCTAPPKPTDRKSGAVEMVTEAIKRIRVAPVATRPNSGEIAALVVAQLEYDGYRISKARKGTLPDRAEVDPITAWTEENAPFADDDDAAAEPDPEPTRPVTRVGDTPDIDSLEAERVEPADREEGVVGRNPEVVVHEPGPPPAL